VKDVRNISKKGNAVVVFILESPHTDEIKKKYPLAGNSGKAVSKLFNQKKPIGALINEKEIKDVAIVNVCNIPMNISAYKCSDLEKINCFDLILLNWLRKTIGTDRKAIDHNFKDCKEEKKEMIEKIVDDMKARLCRLQSKLKTKQIVVVPCGNVAAAFWKKVVCKNNSVSVIEDIPHPSRNQWTENVLNKLKENNIVKSVIQSNK
jgi:NADH/NAD ratio-sensing transcriptional regulator Rex